MAKKRVRERRTNGNVTLKDIAARCEVTPATVSRALRIDDRHSPELTAKIRRVAREMGYNPERQDIARRLSLSQYGKTPVNNIVAAVFPPLFYQTPYFLRVFTGLLEAFSQRRVALLTVYMNSMEDATAPTVFQRGGVDAVIGVPDFTRLVNELHEEPGFRDRPIVSLFEPCADTALVAPDMQAGMLEVGRHLIGLGHRTIGYLRKNTRPEMQFSKHDLQMRGLQDALSEAGLDPQKHLRMIYASETLWELSFSVRINKDPEHADWLRAPEDPHTLAQIEASPDITALVAPNDTMARLLQRMLSRKGMAVPREMTLVGCDNLTLLPDADEPPLTTLAVPLHEIGLRAAVATWEAVTAGRWTGKKLELLPVEFVPGATTAKPRPTSAKA